MRKIIGIRSLVLTCCAVGVLTSTSQAWAIDNCTQIIAQNEADVDSTPNSAADFAEILANNPTDGSNDTNQTYDDESCAGLLVDSSDFGDAPDTYGTTAGAEQAVHTQLYLGTLPDAETAGAPGTAADGDGADEDGVAIPARMLAGETPPDLSVTATNTTANDAFVSCWVDYNQNNTFDSGEFGSATVPAGSTDAVITVDMPATVIPTTATVDNADGYDSYARCRLSTVAVTAENAAVLVEETDPGLTGWTAAGEVEDYPVNFDKFDLALVKTVKAGQTATFNPGDTVVFEVTVENQGSLDATGIVITDYIPSGLTLVSGNGWTAAGSVATLDTPVDLVAGATAAPIEISFTVDNDATIGTLTNAAEISTALDAGGNPMNDIDSTPDSTPDNDTTKDDVTNEDGKNVIGEDEDDHDIATITLAELVDLELSKGVMNKNGTGPITEAFRGDEIMYVLTVTNNGPSDATGVVINDVLPVGVTFVGVAVEDGSGGYTAAPDLAVYDSNPASADYGNWNVGTIPGPVSNGGTPGTATLRLMVTIN